MIITLLTNSTSYLIEILATNAAFFGRDEGSV